ncbi:MAG: CRISPR-associated helicase Cas3' [Candidatus Cloacimonetes bacterium]|jgi:CRISPR-associated endonuclease/helicase Cas3|nr:CRISPR-associated helicase Cas3' [Candidatus Cloacimonadota bacterium]MCK9332770.1 CRISPR-associated helicase Cas3' [Candidatus Cloacimonadota bacterium]
MIISHPAFKEYQRKPLYEHLQNVAKGCRERIQRLSLSPRTIDKQTLCSLAYLIGLLHDIGKAGTAFQKHIRGAKSSAYTKHSLVSALILYEILSQNPRFIDYALLAFKAVQRHHGNLSAFGSENLRDGVLIHTTLEIFEDLKRNIQKDEELLSMLSMHYISIPELDKSAINGLIKKLELFEPIDDAEDAIERFMIQNLLFSVLIDADKYDAARIENVIDAKLKAFPSLSPHNYLCALNPPENELNAIRDKLLIAASSPQGIGNRRFAMSAPTGSGKTLACMAFAEAIQKASQRKRRVLYCLPYTSIIDQNHEEIGLVLSKNGSNANDPDLLLKHHHLVDFSRNDIDEDYDLRDFLNDNLIANSWNSACVVSTFVQLFHSLIGSRNSLLRKLHNILNSIVLLDEVQSLPPKYYPLLRVFFKVLTERFDTIILTCTATQPFIFEPKSFLELSPPELFKSDIFNRVSLEIYSKTLSVEEFAASVDLSKGQNALFVMNTKRSAIDLFILLNKRLGDEYKLYCLTTLHTPICRLKRLEEVRDKLERKERIILVSTQLVEAGVDLSFERVYRDMGPLDSIVQVAGRCNRHGEMGMLGGKMQIVSLHKDGKQYAELIYDNYLLQKTKDVFAGKSVFESKDFGYLIENYYSSISFAAEAQYLLEAIKELNYDQRRQDQLSVDSFRLIQEQYATVSLYILQDTKAQQAMEELISARNFLSKDREDEDAKSRARLKVKQCYHFLGKYQLSLRESDIKNYSVMNSYFNKFKDKIYYIPFEDYLKVYSYETGFLREPLESGSVMVL